MAVAEQVIVDLIARTDNLERGFARARQEGGRLGGAMNALKGAIAGIGAVAAAREFLQLADAAKSIEAQLKLATNATGNFAIAQADTNRIARETRSGLAETVGLYGGFIRAAADLGKSQGQAAQATETFSKALKIGGASSEDAANATRQFLQALAGGILRAEEFNSVVEASPRVAKLFADGLNVSIGGLRKLVNEGKVSADQLFAVLNNRKLTAGIDEEFRQLPVTFDQAMTIVKNAAIETFGAFDRGGQFSTALANFVSGGADGFSDLGKSANDLGITIRAVFDGLDTAFKPLEDSARNAFGFIESEAFRVRNVIAKLLEIRDNLNNTQIALQRGEQSVNNFFLSPFGKARPLTPYQNSRQAFLDSFDASQRAGRGRETARNIDNLFGGTARLGAFLSGEKDALGNSLIKPSRPASSGGAKGRKGRARAGTSKKALTASELLASIQAELVDNTARIGQIETDRERTNDSARRFEVIFGREGTDFDDPFSGVSDYETRRRAARDLAEVEGEEKQRVQDRLFQRQQQDVQSLAQLFETGFRGGVDGIWDQFKAEGLRAIALVLAQLAIGKSLKSAIGSATGPDAGSIFSAIGNVFAKRASGGNVVAGKPYLTGEMGRELFVPAQSGKIYPTGSLQARGGGSMTLVQNINVDGRNSVTPDGFARQIVAVADARARSYAAKAGYAAVEASPARVGRQQTLGT